MLPIDTYIHRLTYYIVSTDDQSVTQAGKDRLKAKIGDAQLAASEPPGAAGEAAPAASAAVGSALESGMASGVAAAPDAEHVDDAGTPHRTFKLVVCFWQPTYTLQLELSTSCDAFVSLLVSRQIHSVLAALVTARALIASWRMFQASQSQKWGEKSSAASQMRRHPKCRKRAVLGLKEHAQKRSTIARPLQKRQGPGRRCLVEQPSRKSQPGIPMGMPLVLTAWRMCIQKTVSSSLLSTILYSLENITLACRKSPSFLRILRGAPKARKRLRCAGDGSDNEALAAPGKKRRGSEQQQATERKDPPQKGQKRLPEEQVCSLSAYF